MLKISVTSVACSARSTIASLGALLLMLPLVAGCGGFGFAKVTGHLSGKTVNVGGTAYAYTDSIMRRSGDAPNKRVVMVMSGAQFNPSIDYAAGSKDGIGNIQQAFANNDLFVIVFHDAGSLRAGARFSNTNLDRELIFGAQSSSKALKLGGQRTLDITLTAVELFGKSGRIRGNFDYYVSPEPGDDPSVLVGHYRGDFDAPLVDTAIAKNNIKLYGSSLSQLSPLNLF